MKNGKIVSMKEELPGDYLSNIRHPRSAICITSEKKVILFVADGRT